MGMGLTRRDSCRTLQVEDVRTRLNDKKIPQTMIDGFRIYYNFIRPHQSLNGQTLAEACGITVEGKNKWKTLIQNASQNVLLRNHSS